jgi:hypothetical protein
MNTEDSPINILAVAEEADDAWFREELASAWRNAHDEAVAAYKAWRESPGPTAYAVYRAAQDRADLAQDVLAYRLPALSGGQ